MEFWSMERMKQGLKKYGRAGVFTYLGLSTMVTTGFYIAIERNVDVGKYMGIKGAGTPRTSEHGSMLKGCGGATRAWRSIRAHVAALRPGRITSRMQRRPAPPRHTAAILGRR